eukprot:117800-Amphidinium_carterae.1
MLGLARRPRSSLEETEEFVMRTEEETYEELASFHNAEALLFSSSHSRMEAALQLIASEETEEQRQLAMLSAASDRWLREGEKVEVQEEGY